MFSEASRVSTLRPASHDGAGVAAGHAGHNSHAGGLLLRHEVGGPGPVQAGAGLRGRQAGEVSERTQLGAVHNLRDRFSAPFQ